MTIELSDGDTDVGDDISRPPRKQAKTLSKACETCKAKKSRCDSSRPQCDTCRRKGVACVYKEKGQPGLRPGYGRAVENRLTMLEDNMEKISRSIQDVLKHVQTQNPSSGQNVDGTNGQPLGANHTQPEPSPREKAQSWQSSPNSLRPPDPPQQPTSGPSFAEMPSLINEIPASMENVTEVPTILDSTLPSQDVLNELVELVFKYIYPWAPLFHKGNFKMNMFSPERQILLHGIVVLGFRFWTRSDPSMEIRNEHVKISREKLLVQTINTASLISYQALTLLAIDSIGQGPSPRTWNLMAILVTCPQQLHLSRSHPLSDGAKSSLVDNEDPENDTTMSTIEAEEQRRLFWTIFSLDRFSSVSLGQPTSIDCRKIRLQYPAKDDAWGQNVPLEWFHRTPPIKPPLTHYPVNMWQYYIDMLTFVDQSNQLLVQPVNLSLPAHCQEWKSKFRRLDITLSTWFENLPPEIQESPGLFDPLWVIFHATFYLINIRMYTVAAFPSTTSPYLKPSSSAQSRCRQAIGGVVCLAASLEPQRIPQLGPMFAFVVWVAARSLVILWTTGHETTYGSMIPDDLESLLHALKQSAIYWPCAQGYSDIIQLILDTKNNPGGPTGLDIFNDTRRTAYGLQSRLGMLASHRFAREMFSNSDDFLDGMFAELIDMPTSQLGFGNLSTEFDGDWL